LSALEVLIEKRKKPSLVDLMKRQPQQLPAS